MAKNIHAAIEWQGTLDGLVFVRSTKYHKHMLAARGTIKKAACKKILRKIEIKNFSRTPMIITPQVL